MTTSCACSTTFRETCRRSTHRSVTALILNERNRLITSRLDCERRAWRLPNRQRLLGGNGGRTVSVAELAVSLAILCKSGKVSRFGYAVPRGIDLNLAP